MNPMMFMFLLLALGLCVLGVIAVVTRVSQNKNTISKAQKIELRNCLILINEIDKICYENREIDPITAPAVLMAIRAHKQKELR